MSARVVARALALIAALGWGGSAALAQTPPAGQAAPPREAPYVADLAELNAPGPLPENVLGNPAAPVTIVEYASLTCPHCATFHNVTLPFLKKDYIDTGRVRLIFRDFPFDMVAMAGTMLSRCAPAEQFFAITEDLFRNQEAWAFSNDPEKPLKELAFRHGFTQESFDACLQRQEIYDGVLAVRQRAHETFRVDSTPTLFVNGVMYRGALTPAQIEAAIKPHLDK